MALGKILFAVALFVCSVHAEVPFITKCLSTDTSCVKQSAQAALPILVAGIPELKVEPLDPLHIDKVDASNKDLEFTSTGAVMTGLQNCIIENIERNVKTSKIIVGVECDTEYRSKYDVHGRVLVVPFEGTGDMLVILRKMYINIESDLTEKVDKNGQKHWFIKKFKYNYDLRGKSDIELTNLFEGNEVLGRAARDLLRSSGNEIIVEVGPPIIKAIVEKIIKTINHFYRAVASEDLALDPF